jgi:hypothetical protein
MDRLFLIFIAIRMTALIVVFVSLDTLVWE